MLDLRIVALGAMALLIAAYGASTVSGPGTTATVASTKADRVTPANAADRPGDITGSIGKPDRHPPDNHLIVDGFDLKQ